jgi:hypothetical protein
MTSPEDKMDITIKEYTEAMARAYDDGYNQAQRDQIKTYKAVEYPKNAQIEASRPYMGGE